MVVLGKKGMAKATSSSSSALSKGSTVSSKSTPWNKTKATQNNANTMTSTATRNDLGRVNTSVVPTRPAANISGHAASKNQDDDDEHTPTNDTPTQAIQNKMNNSPSIARLRNEAYAPVYTGSSSKSSFYGQRTGVTVADTRHSDYRHREQDFYPGLIFSAVLHEQAYTHGPVVPDHKNHTASAYGVISSKYRKMIVLACHASHVTAIPIYTYGGKGLAEKKDPEEYMSIRDVADRDAAAAESSHGILWAKRFPEWPAPIGVSTSSAHLTYIFSHKYIQICTFEGELKPESLEKLYEIVGKPRAFGLGLGRNYNPESIRKRMQQNEKEHLRSKEEKQEGWSQVESKAGKKGTVQAARSMSTRSMSKHSQVSRASKLRNEVQEYGHDQDASRYTGTNW